MRGKEAWRGTVRKAYFCDVSTPELSTDFVRTLQQNSCRGQFCVYISLILIIPTDENLSTCSFSHTKTPKPVDSIMVKC